MLRTTLLAAAVALGSAIPAAASAAPPPNDNYLSSLRINTADGALPPSFEDAIDVTEATTQADLFNPNRDGQELLGGGKEPTTCRPTGTEYANTAWYDFVPPVPGGVEITATGFDAVIAVHRWNPRNSRITRTVRCGNEAGAPVERLGLRRRLKAGASYTIQVGRVVPADAAPQPGALRLTFLYFPDTDGDGTLDEEPDKCLELAGIRAFGGCPPVVRGSPRILFDRPGGGVQVTSLSVAPVDAGTVVVARCAGGCGPAVRVEARRRGVVELPRFDGRVVRAGDRIEVRVTHRKAPRGRYRHGAFGKVFTWPVLADGLGPRRERCVAPGSREQRRCP